MVVFLVQQAVDEWLELPDLARKVLLKAGKIATAAVPVLGVGRVCYFELKRLREQGWPGTWPGWVRACKGTCSFLRPGGAK